MTRTAGTPVRSSVPSPRGTHRSYMKRRARPTAGIDPSGARQREHPATAALRVHLANGLYINALFDRMIGGFRIARPN